MSDPNVTFVARSSISLRRVELVPELPSQRCCSSISSYTVFYLLIFKTTLSNSFCIAVCIMHGALYTPHNHQQPTDEKISSVDSHEGLGEPQPRPILTGRNILLASLAFLSLSTTIFLTSLLGNALNQPSRIHASDASSSSSLSPKPPSPCGTSIPEAISLGCVFDPLTVYWLPPTCSRFGASEFTSFNDGKPWRYWSDVEGREEIIDLPTSGLGLYYTTEAEHMAHCAFMLLRMADALQNDRKGGTRGVDDMTMDFKHSRHCVMMLLNASLSSPTRETINSFGKVQLGSC